MNKVYILLVILIVTGVSIFSKSSTENFNLNYNNSWNQDSFSEIDLSITTADVTVYPADDNEIVLKIYGDAPFNSIEDFIKITDDNGKLKVKQMKKIRRNFKKYDLNVDLYIPRKVYKEIKLSVVTGKIRVKSSLEADHISISAVTGDIDLNMIKANETKINTVTGDLTIRDLNSNIEADVVTGSIDINYSAYSDELVDLSATTGGIKLTLPENSSFKLKSSTITGSVKCDFPVTISGKLKSRKIMGQVGDGLGEVDISVITGSIQINK